MRLQGASWFWITTTMIVGVGVCLAPAPARAEDAYEYEDTFRADFAETDSYLHSVFWPQGAFPPPEPYLYYLDTDSERELGFGGRHGQPAFLGYRFPTGRPQSSRAVSGSLRVDVRFPYDTNVTSSRPGYLRYLLSADGIEWSAPKELGPGSNEIPMSSVRGTCHIVFSGTDVLIDNIHVRLSSLPATIYVPGDFGTIQDAIDGSVDGDVVEVASGTYGGDISFGGAAITVRSADGPGQTTINCSGRRGFIFRREEGSNSVLRGFTIVGGRAPGSAIPSDAGDWKPSSSHPVGGGIFCEFSSPTIVNCVIRDCAAELGGGIGAVGGSPTIIDCEIRQCQAGGLGSAQSRGFGAGIGLIRGADARIYNCAIKNNLAYSDSLGAGLYCWQSSATLANCDISYNSAQATVRGGGVYCGGTEASVVLERCLISNNTAEAGGGVLAEGFNYTRLTNCTVADNSVGGIHSTSGEIEIRNSIVWYNGGAAISLANSISANPVLFSNIQGNYPGQGNIDVEPLFVSRAAGDYHLKSFTGHYDSRMGRWATVNSLEDHSPCIDAGDPLEMADPLDPTGLEPFPNSGRINMGAYGGTAEASKSSGGVIFHVDGARGSDYDNTGTSRSDAFATIQHAVDRTYNDDIVLVWPGVYQEAVSFDSKAITLQSADEAALITAPDPDPLKGYAFTFSGTETSRSVLRNFVILNCGWGAIYCDVASPTLTNLTIADNKFGIVAVSGADPSLASCIFWRNIDGDIWGCRARFSRLQELRGLDAEYGNIDAPPLFADPHNRDYHLQSRSGRYSAGTWVTTDALASPCIDAGDPDVGPGRERPPHGGRVNMGAYGGTPFASLSR